MIIKLPKLKGTSKFRVKVSAGFKGKLKKFRLGMLKITPFRTISIQKEFQEISSLLLKTFRRKVQNDFKKNGCLLEEVL